MVTMVDISPMQRQNYVLRQLQTSTTATEPVFAKPFVSTHGHPWLYGKFKFQSIFSLLTVTNSWGTNIRFGVGSWRLARAASFDFPPHAMAWSLPITRQQNIPSCLNTDVADSCNSITSSTVHMLRPWSHSDTPQSKMCHQMLREHEHSHPGASGAAAPGGRVQGAAKGPANWIL
jgi:hypothetical protein